MACLQPSHLSNKSISWKILEREIIEQINSINIFVLNCSNMFLFYFEFESFSMLGILIRMKKHHGIIKVLLTYAILSVLFCLYISLK